MSSGADRLAAGTTKLAAGAHELTGGLDERYEHEAGIIAWMLFTPLQSRPIAQGLSSVRAVLASYAPTTAAFLMIQLTSAGGIDPVEV